MTTARAAYNECEKIKQALELTPNETGLLDSSNANITGLPLAKDEQSLTKDNMISHFTDDYKSISIYALYLENATAMAEAHSEINLTTLIKAVTKVFYDWLCKVDTTLRYLSSPVKMFVNSTVVDAEYPTYSKERFSHYYILAKSVQNFINSKNKKYSKFLETVKP